MKNYHLGFEVLYVYHGVVWKYRPDFIIRFKSGGYLVLETKGKDSEQNQTKHRFLNEWVNAVREYGRFARWSWDVSRDPGDIKDILARQLICPVTKQPPVLRVPRRTRSPPLRLPRGKKRVTE